MKSFLGCTIYKPQERGHRKLKQEYIIRETNDNDIDLPENDKYLCCLCCTLKSSLFHCDD